MNFFSLFPKMQAAETYLQELKDTSVDFTRLLVASQMLEFDFRGKVARRPSDPKPTRELHRSIYDSPKAAQILAVFSSTLADLVQRFTIVRRGYSQLLKLYTDIETRPSIDSDRYNQLFSFDLEA